MHSEVVGKAAGTSCSSRARIVSDGESKPCICLGKLLRQRASMEMREGAIHGFSVKTKVLEGLFAIRGRALFSSPVSSILYPPGQVRAANRCATTVML